mgnify:CR=1 FL=1
MTTGAVHDLDFWKEISGYDRQAVKATTVLEKAAKQGKKKKTKGGAKSKGFGK